MNKDIPQFTRTPCYMVNMGLKYFKEWIIEHQKELNLELNPDFQRGYVWTEKQKIKYIEFLLMGGTSARDIYFNHPGWMSSFKGEFVCVDGLQRLTSILEFLDKKFKVFGDYYFDEIQIGSTDPTLIIHINDLKTRKEVLKWYLEFNSGGTVHTEAELDKVRKMIEEEK
jgi:hypothetical protein